MVDFIRNKDLVSSRFESKTTSTGVADGTTSISVTSDTITTTSPVGVDTIIGSNSVFNASGTTDKTVLQNPTSTSAIQLEDELLLLGTSTGGNVVFTDGLLRAPATTQLTTNVISTVTQHVSSPSTTDFTFNLVVHDPRSAWSSPTRYVCEVDGYYLIAFTAFVIYSPSVSDIYIAYDFNTGAVSYQELAVVLASNSMQNWDSRMISWTYTGWMDATNVLTVLSLVTGTGGTGQIEYRAAKLVVNKLT